VEQEWGVEKAVTSVKRGKIEQISSFFWVADLREIRLLIYFAVS